VDILDSGSLKIQYNRNRYYDYYSGRWLTHDPLGITPNPQLPNMFDAIGQYNDGLSLYEYVGSNPLSRYDPIGTRVKKHEMDKWMPRETGEHVIDRFEKSPCIPIIGRTIRWEKEKKSSISIVDSYTWEPRRWWRHKCVARSTKYYYDKTKYVGRVKMFSCKKYGWPWARKCGCKYEIKVGRYSCVHIYKKKKDSNRYLPMTEAQCINLESNRVARAAYRRVLELLIQCEGVFNPPLISSR
jgi:RHS repeat-associated protein